MRLFLSLSILVLSLTFGLFEPHNLALAQVEQNGLSASPMFQEVVINEGEREKSFSIELKNGTAQPITLRVSLLDFGTLDESGGVAFLGAASELEKKYALAAWMRPEKDALTLSPGETQSVQVTIENRETLSPGGHYGAIVFKAGEDAGTESGENVIAVSQLFSVLVFAKKIGGEVYDLKLKTEEYPQSYFSLPETIRLRFQNAGNVHLVPRGIVTLSDPLGRVVRKGIINEESAIILPETLRVYPSSFKAVERVFMPGRYTLSIQYRYDGQEAFTETKRSFVFVPLPVTIVVLGVLAFVIWFGSRFLKRGRTKTEK